MIPFPWSLTSLPPDFVSPCVVISRSPPCLLALFTFQSPLVSTWKAFEGCCSDYLLACIRKKALQPILCLSFGQLFFSSLSSQHCIMVGKAANTLVVEKKGFLWWGNAIGVIGLGGWFCVFGLIRFKFESMRVRVQRILLVYLLPIPFPFHIVYMMFLRTPYYVVIVCSWMGYTLSSSLFRFRFCLHISLRSPLISYASSFPRSALSVQNTISASFAWPLRPCSPLHPSRLG